MPASMFSSLCSKGLVVTRFKVMNQFLFGLSILHSWWVCLSLHALFQGTTEAERFHGGAPFITTKKWHGFRVIPEGPRGALSCEACGQQSTAASPFQDAHNGDIWGGFRPWCKYKTSHSQRTRTAYGRRCLICVNVFQRGGQHGVAQT